MSLAKDLQIDNGELCFSCHTMIVDDDETPFEFGHPVQCESCGKGMPNSCWFDPSAGEIVYAMEAAVVQSNTKRQE